MSVYANSVLAPPSSGYATPDQKELTVQDRVDAALGFLREAHRGLSALENAPNDPGGSLPSPTLGLLDGAMAIHEEAASLAKRIDQLRQQLGHL